MVKSLQLVMVSLLFLSRSLRTKEDNEKKRKHEKRNEIQCIIFFILIKWFNLVLNLVKLRINQYK